MLMHQNGHTLKSRRERETWVDGTLLLVFLTEAGPLAPDRGSGSAEGLQ